MALYATYDEIVFFESIFEVVNLYSRNSEVDKTIRRIVPCEEHRLTGMYIP